MKENNLAESKTKEERRQERRQRAAEMRKQAKKKARRDKIVRVSALVSVIAVLIGLTGYIAVTAHNKKDSEGWTQASTQLTPKNFDEHGAFQVKSDNLKSSATRVDDFFDPLCPGCGAVHRASGDRMKELVKSGDIDLRLSPVSFLDEASTDKYSTRAINAFVTVAENSPEHALEFLSALYRKDFQPQEGTQNYGQKPVTDQALVEAAVGAGVPADVAKTIPEHRYADWINNTSEKQVKRSDLFPSGFSTPAIFTGVKYSSDGKASGTKIDFKNKDILRAFNEAIGVK